MKFPVLRMRPGGVSCIGKKYGQLHPWTDAGFVFLTGVKLYSREGQIPKCPRDIFGSAAGDLTGINQQEEYKGEREENR